jgi:hypothetical protein
MNRTQKENSEFLKKIVQAGGKQDQNMKDCEIL